MTDHVAPRRPSPVWLLLGLLLIVAAACLLSWAAFNVARGPSACGGDAEACPDGFVPALLGGFGSIFLVGPVGTALVARHALRTVPAALALLVGAVAAGVYVARFEAAPVTDATLATWIVTVALGLLAVLLVLPALAPRAAAAPAEVEAELRRRRGAGPSDGDRSGGGAGGPRVADAGTTSRRPSPTPRAAPGMTEIHDLLAHGLTSGDLGRDGPGATSTPAARAHVAQLLDLHARGVLSDDDLRTALRTLRDDRGRRDR